MPRITLRYCLAGVTLGACLWATLVLLLVNTPRDARPPPPPQTSPQPQQPLQPPDVAPAPRPDVPRAPLVPPGSRTGHVARSDDAQERALALCANGTRFASLRSQGVPRSARNWERCLAVRCARDPVCDSPSDAPPAGAPCCRRGLVRPCCTDTLRLLLYTVDDVLAGMRLPYYVTHGTLLEAVRSRSIIPWTADLDIVMGRREATQLYENATVRGALWERGLIAFVDPNAAPLKRVCFATGAPRADVLLPWADCTFVHTRARPYYGISSYMDVYPAVLLNGTALNQLAGASQCLFPLRDVLPLSSVTIDGREVPAPRHPHPMLEKMYGATWQTPDKGKQLHGHAPPSPLPWWHTPASAAAEGNAAMPGWPGGPHDRVEGTLESTVRVESAGDVVRVYTSADTYEPDIFAGCERTCVREPAWERAHVAMGRSNSVWAPVWRERSRARNGTLVLAAWDGEPSMLNKPVLEPARVLGPDVPGILVYFSRTAQVQVSALSPSTWALTYEEATAPGRRTAVFVSSKCRSTWGRDELVRALHDTGLPISFGGKCVAPGAQREPVPKLPGEHIVWTAHLVAHYAHFKFVLALENSIEPWYHTEKLANAWAAGAVPVYVGAPTVVLLAPTPGPSYIDATQFRGPQALVRYLFYLDGNASAYAEYHAWRRAPLHAFPSVHNGTLSVGRLPLGYAPDARAYAPGEYTRYALGCRVCACYRAGAACRTSSETSADLRWSLTPEAPPAYRFHTNDWIATHTSVPLRD